MAGSARSDGRSSEVVLCGQRRQHVRCVVRLWLRLRPLRQKQLPRMQDRSVSKLLQHVGGWTDAVDELHRVTVPGDLFLHINEKGAFKNAVRSTFSRLASGESFGSGYPGLLDRTQLPRHLEASGARRVDVTDGLVEWFRKPPSGRGAVLSIIPQSYPVVTSLRTRD